MYKVNDILSLALSGGLTCAHAAQLLAEQPHSSADGEKSPHGQLHLRDGFMPNPDKIGIMNSAVPQPPLSDRQKRVDEWNAWDAHLYPSGKSGLPSYSTLSDVNGDHVYLDSQMVPKSMAYALRTGLDEIAEAPGISKTSYYIFKIDTKNKGARTRVDLKSKDDPLPPLGGGEIWEQTKTTPKVNWIREEIIWITPTLPRVPRSPAHTMFEDSESMVMCLTGALLSEAGKLLLQEMNKTTFVPLSTVGLFSKTAVIAAENAIKKAKATGKWATSVNTSAMPQSPQMLERTAKTDPGDVRKVSTKEVNVAILAIDHVEAILSCTADKDLRVMTFYPSKQTIFDAIGISPNSPSIDIAETVFKTTFVRDCLPTVPEVRWA